MKNKKKFSILLILIYIYVEKLHRYVYDNYYRQDYKITFKDKIVILLYDVLLRTFPKFRSQLKYWKPILKRAYHLRRLSFANQIADTKLRKINVERYSLEIF